MSATHFIDRKTRLIQRTATALLLVGAALFPSLSLAQDEVPPPLDGEENEGSQQILTDLSEEQRRQLHELQELQSVAEQQLSQLSSFLRRPRRTESERELAELEELRFERAGAYLERSRIENINKDRFERAELTALFAQATHDVRLAIAVLNLDQTKHAVHRTEQQSATVGSIGALNEAVGALGAIVADRASSALLQRVSSHVQEWLHCSHAEQEGSAFPRTCSYLRDIRLRDVVAAPERILGAMISDMLQLGLRELALLDNSGVSSFLEAVVVPTLLQAVDGRLDEFSTLQLQNLLTELQRTHRSLTGDNSPGAQALRGAFAAYTACMQHSEPALCPVAVIANEVSELDDSTVQRRASDLAAHLLAISTLQRREGDEQVPDVLGRIHQAADASVAVACLLAGNMDARCGHFESERRPGEDGNARVVWVLGHVRNLLHAGLERDGHAVLVASFGLVQGLMRGDADTQRAVRVLGSIVAYARSYRAASEAGTVEATREARKEILEAVVDEFTDRTDRAGDWVFSVGGSLRLFAGAQRTFGSDNDTFSLRSPLSLSLGFGVHRVPGSGPGFGLELSILDLGQYLAFEDGLELRSPDVRDALAPSITVSLNWGRQIPMFVGATLGYAPTLRQPTQEDNMSGIEEDPGNGSLFFGLTFGAYVPLFDFN